MVKPIVTVEKSIDLSFMPSLQCDLTCAHCMYGSSPTNTATLDFEATKAFAETIDWDLINSCGFYGGEPGINIPMYERFMALVPGGVPKFTITDGTWSRTPGRPGAPASSWSSQSGTTCRCSSARRSTTPRSRTPGAWRRFIMNTAGSSTRTGTRT